MVSSLSRKQLTDRLIRELDLEGFPVGDNSAPDDTYGWSGEPNSSDSYFIPWMSLQPLVGQPQRIQTIGDTGREWVLPYTVFYAAVSRAQCEALADKMRNNLTNISRESVDTPTGGWKILKISCTAVGGNSRITSSYPDYYTQTDSFEVWTSKEQV